MFEALRKMIFPIIIVVLLFFVAMIVLQWGLDISGQKRFATAAAAGVINGEEVSWDVFQRVFSGMYQEAAQDVDEELPESKIIELEQNAWQTILQDRLLVQQAAKHNITVTEDDLFLFLRTAPPQYLQEYTGFQTEGRFDYQKYIGAMADPQWDPFWASIEPQVRGDLRKAKMQQLIIETANVTENEIRQAYLDAEEKVKVRMINVASARFGQPAPQLSDSELIAYYEENKENYQTDERVVLDLVYLEKKASEDDWGKARDRAEKTMDSALAGADFAELARTYSEDPGSARNGGDLGWFARGRMVPAFDSLAFAMKEGEISEVLRTQFGWHVLKHHGYRTDVEEVSGKNIKESVQKAHVSHILVKAQPSLETLDSMYNRLEEFRETAVEQGFQQASEQTGLEIKTTRPELRERPIQWVGDSPQASRFAFESDTGSVTDVLENDRFYFVARVARKLPKGPAEYAEVSSRVFQDLSRATLARLCGDTARAIYAEIQRGTEYEGAAKMFGEEIESPDEFNRDSFVAGLGRDPKAIGAAFSLTEPGQISPPVDHRGGCTIFSLIKRTTPDLSSFNEKRDSIYTTLMTYKQQDLYGRWFNSLVENSEIQNNVELQRELAESSQ